MKWLVALFIACALAGCGSTRETHSQTVERTRQVMTAPDGQITTTETMRTEETNADSKTEIDLKPPKEVMGWLSIATKLISGIDFRSVFDAVMLIWAGGATMNARGHKRRADLHMDSENELWSMHKDDWNSTP